MITPMQELIEWVRNHPGQTGKSLVIDKATELLENEKEMIMTAVNYGCSDWGSYKDAEEYYNETFNTKEK
jgi:hypothetical protein